MSGKEYHVDRLGRLIGLDEHWRIANAVPPEGNVPNLLNEKKIMPV